MSVHAGPSKTAGAIWGLVLVALVAAIVAGLGGAYRGQASWAMGAGALLAVDVLLTVCLLATSSQHDRVRMGLWGILQLDVLGLLLLGCGWALGGGQAALGALLGAAFAAVAVSGYTCRRQVRDRSRLGLVVGLVPLLAAGGGAEGLVLARVLEPLPSVIAAIFAVIGLYLALVAQSLAPEARSRY